MSESPFEAKLKAVYGDVYESRKPATGDAAPLRTETAMQLQEKVITVNAYVLGINIEYNEPDIFVTQVTCTEQEYYEEGLHLIMAEERAKQSGFVDPLFSFDERETAVIDKLGKLFGKP
jgi:hypothetical protein